MFVHIALFELRYQLRRPVFWVCFGLFFLLTFGAVTSDAVTIGGSIGQVNRNAPFVIMQILLVMSSLGVLITTAFVADTVQRDHELRCEELFFSTRMRRREYLMGRFSGAFATAVLLFCGVALAILLGSFMPWLEPDRVGPTLASPYLSSMVLLVIPNLLLQSCLFFGLATWTRSLRWTYVGTIAFMVGYFVSQSYLGDLESESIAALLDPFGFAAFGTATRYWTVADRNTLSLPLGRDLLLNRLLWLGIGLAVLGVTWARFRLGLPSGRRERGAPARGASGLLEPGSVHRLELPPTTRRFDVSTAFRQYLYQARIELRSMLFSAPFLVIVAFGFLNVVGSSGSLDHRGFGAEIHPVTHEVLRVIDGSFLFLVIILTAYFAGEVVFRERSSGFSGVHDSLPAPNWVFGGAKLTALFAALGVMLTAAMLAGIGIQLWRGYHLLELPLYLKWLFLKTGIPFLMVAVLALALQVLTGNRYLGYTGMLVFLISSAALQALHFQHNLYHFAGAPEPVYSDMNGFGHFVRPLVWFYLYWAFFTAALLVVTHLFWLRGADTDFRSRLRVARQRFTTGPRLVLATSLLAFAATGGYIYWNTNVLNRYIPDDVAWDRQAEYEKAYAQYLGLPQPRITEVDADVDIWPHERAVDIRGTYTLKNKTAGPIERVHLWLNPEVKKRDLVLPGATVELDDPVHGYSIRRLATPLAPGGEVTLSYTLRVESPGFVNHSSNVRLVENGTFFDSHHYFPHIGYQKDSELQDPNERRKRGLEPIQRMPRLEDEEARHDNALSSEADWVWFKTTVSTAADQIAMAPGYLEREWTEGERRYFRYAMDAPILAFWAYVSARYEVARGDWKGLPIEVYHHPAHAYNVERMIDAVKKSLDYYTASFSPYQHRQVRILEFPGYRSFAQSFPNTIPYSEAIGFIVKLDEKLEPDQIDNIFYVTAHEIAHQWWAHQVIGGNVQGATVLAETLSQYSALMVMEEEYGPRHMRKFLEQELDLYLRRRGSERIEELPMLRVENQPYLHYNKGSVVMYALKDAIGAEAVNEALRSFIRRTSYQEPPYTTTAELLDELRVVTPEQQQGILTDLFERITLYDNRAAEAHYTERADGRFQVTLRIESRKLESDGQGAEREIPIHDFIDVAVFGEKTDDSPPEGELLHLEKVPITPETREVTLVVDQRPIKAGIDPFLKLVDRKPDDNLVKVSAFQKSP